VLVGLGLGVMGVSALLVERRLVAFDARADAGTAPTDR
jgi:hypothetical protein